MNHALYIASRYMNSVFILFTLMLVILKIFGVYTMRSLWVRLWSWCGCLQLNVESRKQRHTIALVFWYRKYRQNSNGVTPTGGAKCMWDRFNPGAVAANWRLSTRSFVNLVRSQVYHTERPPYLFAARSLFAVMQRVTRVCQRQLIFVE